MGTQNRLSATWLPEAEVPRLLAALEVPAPQADRPGALRRQSAANF
jgi:hypothetical protein